MMSVILVVAAFWLGEFVVAAAVLGFALWRSRSPAAVKAIEAPAPAIGAIGGAAAVAAGAVVAAP